MNSANTLTIYCIPGLGVNKHLFKKLKLDAYVVRHIDWIEPLKKETLESYAMRMAQQIDTSGPFVLMGVSFGGMCCIEIAKHLSPLKTILISSCKTRNELPIRLRMLAILPIHFLANGNLYLKSAWLLKRIFKITPEMERAFGDVISPLPRNYLRRTIQMVVHWKNKTYPDGVVHIHGREDAVLLYKKNASYQYTIEGGTHIMVMNRAEEISEIVNKELGALHKK